MDPLPILFFPFGAIIGSFLNVCIHRMPRDQSLVRPASHCPHCRHRIAFYDNVPLVSYLVLGGRCRHCSRPISPRYPLVEVLTAVLFASLAWRWSAERPWAAAACLATACLEAIAFIDWDTFLIPDVLSLGLVVVGVLAAPVNPLFPGGIGHKLVYSVVGGAAGFAICWGVAWFGEALFKREAMGGGDVKLLAAVGAWSGALGAFDCLIVASFLGSAYGASLLLRGKLKRQDPIPFGPFLAAAAVFNFFYLLPFGFPVIN